MAEDIQVEEEIVLEEGPNPMLEMARKVLLAGIGAMALTQEEIEKFVNKLIERGEIAEKDGRKLITDVVEKRKSRAKKVRSDTEEELDHRMEDILTRMNIPSKTDIAELNKKLTALTKKVDELKKAQG